MTEQAAGVERERDFYFESGSSSLYYLSSHSDIDCWVIELRQIEIIVQRRTAVEGIDAGEKEVLSQIQEILYDTAVSGYLLSFYACADWYNL